jgi:hypothetical protein
MQISEIDCKKGEYTDEEMNAMCDLMEKAHEISSDPALAKAVGKHMKRRANKLKSTADLRAKLSDLERTPEPTKGA